ncbi:hypothetical protein D3C87_1093490 [compost metagenome]
MKHSFENTIVVLAGSLFLATQSFAGAQVIGQKVLDIPDGKGQVMVTTTKTDVNLGRPFTVELRVKCGTGKTNWDAIKVVDSESVCDVKAESAKISADGKSLTIQIRETDAAAFNELSKTVDAKEIGELKPQCQKVGKEFTFSLSKCL